MSDKNFKKQVFQEKNKQNQKINKAKKKPLNDSKEEKQNNETNQNMKNLDEVKQLLQQSASSYRSLRNSDRPNATEKKVTIQESKNEFEPDSLSQSVVQNQYLNREYTHDSGTFHSKDVTMDEDLDTELQNLKSINSKSVNINKNNHSSPIFQPTQDYMIDSGSYNPDLKLVYSDTINSVRTSNNFTLSPQDTKNTLNSNTLTFQKPTHSMKIDQLDINNSKDQLNNKNKSAKSVDNKKQFDQSFQDTKLSKSMKSVESAEVKIKLSDIPLRFRNKQSFMERDIFEFQNQLSNTDYLRNHRKDQVIHLTNLLEELFEKASMQHNSKDIVQIQDSQNEYTNVTTEALEQQTSRIKELVDENEQLRQRLKVQRNAENQQTNIVELVEMLRDSQNKLEKSNMSLTQELERMRIEKEGMSKEWEKQVVELTQAVDSLKKRVQGDQVDNVGVKTSRTTARSNHNNNNGNMYIENQLE